MEINNAYNLSLRFIYSHFEGKLKKEPPIHKHKWPMRSTRFGWDSRYIHQMPNMNVHANLCNSKSMDKLLNYHMHFIAKTTY